MIGLYFRAILDANLLDTVCISMRACIFPAGSHKGVVFASRVVTLRISRFFSRSAFFFVPSLRKVSRATKETRYNRRVLARAEDLPRRGIANTRTGTVCVVAENARRLSAASD